MKKRARNTWRYIGIFCHFLFCWIIYWLKFWKCRYTGFELHFGIINKQLHSLHILSKLECTKILLKLRYEIVEWKEVSLKNTLISLVPIISATNRTSCWSLNVRGPNHSGWTKPVSWLLMPWLLSSPGHQHEWYWLCGIGKFLPYMRKDFIYLCHVSVEEWYKL